VYSSFKMHIAYVFDRKHFCGSTQTYVVLGECSGNGDLHVEELLLDDGSGVHIPIVLLNRRPLLVHRSGFEIRGIREELCSLIFILGSDVPTHSAGLCWHR